MYVPEWWPKDGKGEILRILRMCEMLHMDHTGSYQDMKDGERATMLKALRWKRDNWTYVLSPYDCVVFSLIRCTLAERGIV